MNAYREAINDALKQGYLVSGSGVTWLDCEIRWRRHCQSAGVPVVVVSPRKRLADVSLFLHRIPHADITRDELVERLLDAEPLGFSPDRISVTRGMMGVEEMFQAMTIEDIEIKEALRIAPMLLDTGNELVAAAQATVN